MLTIQVGFAVQGLEDVVRVELAGGGIRDSFSVAVARCVLDGRNSFFDTLGRNCCPDLLECDLSGSEIDELHESRPFELHYQLLVQIEQIGGVHRSEEHTSELQSQSFL